jgi:hypothetical protein
MLHARQAISPERDDSIGDTHPRDERACARERRFANIRRDGSLGHATTDGGNG